MMTRLVKQVFTGTRWEEPLKRVHHSLTGYKGTLYDWQTIAIMRRVLRSDANALDVGAFEGGMLKHMTRLAPRGRHMAFEPQPDRYERLRAEFPMVDVRPYAIGDEKGTVTFHCMDAHPALSGLSRRERDLSGERPLEIRVPMETLDGTVPPDLPVHFVKIDVEGAELGVFRGGIDVLRRNRLRSPRRRRLELRLWQLGLVHVRLRSRPRVVPQPKDAARLRGHLRSHPHV